MQGEDLKAACACREEKKKEKKKVSVRSAWRKVLAEKSAHFCNYRSALCCGFSVRQSTKAVRDNRLR